LSARSLVLSLGAISSFIAAAIVILFAASLTSVAFADERRGLPVTADDRGYVGGRLAYANPENEGLSRHYYARPTQARTPPNRPALDAAVSVAPMPNVVMFNARWVEIVSPDEVNSIDLAADTPGLDEQADVRSAPLAASANVTSLAQALSVIAGALAGLSVGLLLIRWRSERISRLELPKSLASL
jgi:hypothetical protein